MRRPRIYQDINLTPIKQPNPLWVGRDGKKQWEGSTDPEDMPNGTPKWIQDFLQFDAMKSLGFEEMFMLYDGTLNRAPVWCNDKPNPAAEINPATGKPYDPTASKWIFELRKKEEIDWNRQGNFSAPPQEKQIQMCMHLNHTGPVYNPKAKPYNPIIFDLENPSVDYQNSMFDKPPRKPRVELAWDNTGAMWLREQDDPAYQKEVRESGKWEIENIVNSVQYARNWHRWASMPPIGHYQFPWPLNNFQTNRQTDDWYIHSGLRDLCEIIDFCAPSFYNINWNHWSLGNPSTWYDVVDLCTTLYDRRCSHLPRVAVITPTYSVFWPEQEQYKKYLPDADKAMPLEVWKRQVNYLVERDYDIMIWSGMIPLTPEVYGNLQYVAELAR
jgi:hypothetical protein